MYNHYITRMLRKILLFLVLGATPAFAGCPEEMSLHGRAWVLDADQEVPHFQLWNNGPNDIVLKAFNVHSTKRMWFVAGPTTEKLVYSIEDYGAAFPMGVNGYGDGVTPAGASLNGELRAQRSTGLWLLTQAWHFTAEESNEPIEVFDGYVIPPNHGFTLRGAAGGAFARGSFTWCE